MLVMAMVIAMVLYRSAMGADVDDGQRCDTIMISGINLTISRMIMATIIVKMTMTMVQLGREHLH